MTTQKMRYVRHVHKAETFVEFCLKMLKDDEMDVALMHLELAKTHIEAAITRKTIVAAELPSPNEILQVEEEKAITQGLTLVCVVCKKLPEQCICMKRPPARCPNCDLVIEDCVCH